MCFSVPSQSSMHSKWRIHQILVCFLLLLAGVGKSAAPCYWAASSINRRQCCWSFNRLGLLKISFGSIIDMNMQVWDHSESDRRPAQGPSHGVHPRAGGPPRNTHPGRALLTFQCGIYIQCMSFTKILYNPELLVFLCVSLFLLMFYNCLAKIRMCL